MRTTAGLLMYQLNPLKVFIVKSGGPHIDSDDGKWSIPKGHVEPGEELLEAALREFEEEIGFKPDLGKVYFDLNRVILKPGKDLWAWGFPGNIPENWVLKSKMYTHWDNDILYPEVEEANFYTVDESKIKLPSSQFELIRRLQRIVNLDDNNKINSKCLRFNEFDE